jgi:hypothetical protein
MSRIYAFSTGMVSRHQMHKNNHNNHKNLKIRIKKRIKRNPIRLIIIIRKNSKKTNLGLSKLKTSKKCLSMKTTKKVKNRRMGKRKFHQRVSLGEEKNKSNQSQLAFVKKLSS